MLHSPPLKMLSGILNVICCVCDVEWNITPPLLYVSRCGRVFRCRQSVDTSTRSRVRCSSSCLMSLSNHISRWSAQARQALRSPFKKVGFKRSSTLMSRQQSLWQWTLVQTLMVSSCPHLIIFVNLISTQTVDQILCCWEFACLYQHSRLLLLAASNRLPTELVDAFHASFQALLENILLQDCLL